LFVGRVVVVGSVVVVDVVDVGRLFLDKEVLLLLLATVVVFFFGMVFFSKFYARGVCMYYLRAERERDGERMGERGRGREGVGGVACVCVSFLSIFGQGVCVCVAGVCVFPLTRKHGDDCGESLSRG